MEADSQLARAQSTHRIGFAPWQDAGPRVPGRGAQHSPAWPHLGPLLTFPMLGAYHHLPNPAFPKLTSSSLGTWKGVGGDTQAHDPVPTPGQEPPPTCSESEKRNSIVYTHSSGHSQGSWSARSVAGKPGALRPLHTWAICPWAIPPVWLPDTGVPRAVAAQGMGGSPVGDSLPLWHSTYTSQEAGGAPQKSDDGRRPPVPIPTPYLSPPLHPEASRVPGTPSVGWLEA